MKFFRFINSSVFIIGLFFCIPTNAKDLNLDYFLKNVEKSHLATGISVYKGLTEEAELMFGNELYKSLAFAAGFGNYNLSTDFLYEIRISEAKHWTDNTLSGTIGSYYSHELAVGLLTYLVNTEKIKNTLFFSANALYESLTTSTSVLQEKERTIAGFTIGTGFEVHFAKNMYAEIRFSLKHLNTRDMFLMTFLLAIGN